MAWPIPAEGAIADRYKRGFETAFATYPDGTPLPGPVDTGPDTAFGAIAETADETHTELYLYQQSLSLELMADTATDGDGGWLPRHAAQWGVPQILPLPALGNILFTGTPETPLAIGIEVTLAGVVWATTANATIPAGGVVSIPVQAEVTGSAGNLAAGSVVTLVSAVTGITQTTATVDASGLQGGTDLEATEAWRARILLRIRSRGAAGTVADYTNWALLGGATYVQVVPQIAGAGTVGVYVAIAGPAVPNPAVLARIDAAIQLYRPVTAVVVTIAASLLPVPLTLAVSPDSVAIRAAASLGAQALFLAEGLPGTVLPLQRINQAIEASDGEYTHVLGAPVADITPAAGQIPVLGAITFTSGAALPQRPVGVVG